VIAGGNHVALIIRISKISQRFYKNLFQFYKISSQREACETFHKARLPAQGPVDIFPREQPRTVLAQASGAFLKP
jgi:hypothetical protein